MARITASAVDPNGYVAERLTFDDTRLRYKLRSRPRIYGAWRGAGESRRNALRWTVRRKTRYPMPTGNDAAAIERYLGDKYDIPVEWAGTGVYHFDASKLTGLRDGDPISHFPNNGEKGRP